MRLKYAQTKNSFARISGSREREKREREKERERKRETESGRRRGYEKDI